MELSSFMGDVMMLNAIYSEINGILKDIGSIDGEILPDMLLSHYGFESLKTMKLIIALESKYDFEVNVEDLSADNFSTLNKIVNYIHAKQLQEK